MKDGVATQFKPGQGGRPKGAISIKSRLKKLGQLEIGIIDPINGNKIRQEIFDVIAQRLIGKALKGDLSSMKLIFDIVDGRGYGVEEYKPETPVYDYKKLTLDERKTLISLMDKLTAA